MAADEREHHAMTIAGYRIIDTHTGRQVGHDYAANQGTRAHRRADKLDAEYGAVRYVVRLILIPSAVEATLAGA